MAGNLNAVATTMTPRSAIDLMSFKASLDRNAPPNGLGQALQSLWYQAKGDWKRAQRLARARDDKASVWVHAHLHRVDGDNANAGYWYRRAGKPHSPAPPEEELDEIVAALLRGHA